MNKMKQNKAISNSAADKNGNKATSKEGGQKKYRKRDKNAVGRRVVKEIVASNPELQECMGNVSRLVKAFANPFDYGCVRLPSQFQYYPTAVANPFMKLPATFAGIDTDSSTSNATVGFLFRDQFRSAIISMNSQPGFAYVSGTFTILSPANVAGSEQPLPLWPLVFNQAQPGFTRVHGDAMYPGVLPGCDLGFYWAQPGDTLSFSNQMAGNNAIKIYRWDGANKQFIASIVAPAGGTGTYSPLAPAYYGFTVSNGTANQTGTMNFGISLLTSVRNHTFGHFALPEMYGSFANIVEAAKIYAGSIMLTNQAAPLVRQGKIASAQIPTGRYWFDFTTYTSVADTRDGVTKDAVDGAYSFLKPTQPDDFNFRNETSITVSDDLGFYSLVPDSDFLAHYCVVNTAEGRDFQWTLCWGLEYRTTSKWIDVEESDIPDSVLSCFHMMFSKIPQHYTNEFHISDIGDWIKNAASKVYTFVKDALPHVITAGTTVAKVAGTLAPLLI